MSHPLSIDLPFALYNGFNFFKWYLFLVQPVFKKFSCFFHIGPFCRFLFSFHGSSGHLKKMQSIIFIVFGEQLHVYSAGKSFSYKFFREKFSFLPVFAFFHSRMKSPGL